MEILFLQRPEVLDQQRELVDERLAALEGAEVGMAGSPGEALRHPGTRVLLCPTLPWLPEVVAGLPRLEWIHFLSAGVDRIWDMPFDPGRYRLSKSTGVHADTMSEYALAAVLYALKGFGRFRRQQDRREWTRVRLEECAGKTLTIVGMGTVGRRLAERARALGMRVVGVASAARQVPGADAVLGPDRLEEALAAGDFVVVLVPLTAATRGLMGRAALAAMKPSTWLINIARGEVLDEAALVDALEGRRLAGAVLDVFEEEPLPPESPLWGFDNVLITPHVAGTTQHYMARALDLFVDNYRAYVASGRLTTPVSPERGY